MTLVLMLADDLTGALDASAGFSARGMSVAVAVRPDGIKAALAHAPEVLVVSTGTREAPAEAAERIVAAVLERLGGLGAEIVFKKIDSRLKGPLAAETRALLRRGHSSVLAAPAIPEFGRWVQGGLLVGPGVAVPMPVAAAFAGCGAAVTVPEVDSDADLDAAVAARQPGQLLAGARGLALALARALRPAAEPSPRAVPGPLLLAVGSRDPITLAQLTHLQANTPPHRYRLLRPGEPEAGETAAGFAARFARAVAAAAGRMDRGTLFACGGETAQAVLDTLGIAVVLPEGEVFAGVPVSRLPGCPLRLVSKSGGFGPPDLLSALVALAPG